MTTGVPEDPLVAHRMGEAPKGIRVAHLYDRYLNIYADRGNIQVLQQRCAWRGLTCDVSGIGLDDGLEAGTFDLAYVGGGQDRDQAMIAERLAGAVGAAVRHAVDEGVAVLAVCGGYQLLGHGYHDTNGVDQPGAGVLDASTTAGTTRMIGNVAIEATLPAVGRDGTPGHRPARTTTVVGFENHAGRTTLAAGATPFGAVLHGSGNDGSSGHEGVLHGTAVGTYLHGPLLPRNPELADWLIATALHHRYGDEAPALAELAPELRQLEDAARVVALGRARAERR